MSRSGGILGSLAVLGLVLSFCTAASADPRATSWVTGHGSKVRLLTGAVAQEAQSPRLVAGVEMNMSPGWKTYWRMPGDSGGLPPHFDWSGSVNLASATVYYPAPHRFKDASGDSVGYAGSVLFPIEVRPEDPSKPVELRLAISYGVCREICVPAEAKLALPIPAGGIGVGSPEIATGLAAVPRSTAERQASDPELKAGEAHLGSERPRLVFEVRYPASAASGDLFVEAPDSSYLPLPVRTSAQGDTVRFEVDLSEVDNAAALRGKSVLLTMVSDAGQSETRWTVE